MDQLHCNRLTDIVFIANVQIYKQFNLAFSLKSLAMLKTFVIILDFSITAYWKW